jgi:hypothetical protein
MPKASKKTTTHRRTHFSTLYSYVKKVNGAFARTFGTKTYGNYSAYVDHLIEQDRLRNMPTRTNHRKAAAKGRTRRSK